jgi:hypothetical protein
MAVSYLPNTPITGKSYTTPVDATVDEDPPYGPAEDLGSLQARGPWRLKR